MKKSLTKTKSRKLAGKSPALDVADCSAFSTQAEAMDWLRKNHPDFFTDEEVREVAAVIVLSLAEELRSMSALKRTAIIAGTMALMYQMGSAAIKSIGDDGKRKMGRILADTFKQNHACAR